MARVKTGAPALGIKRKKIDPAELVTALAKSAGGIDAGGLLESLIEQWGGRQRLAMDIFAEYKASKPGSMTRLRVIELVTRLTVVVTAQDLSRPKSAADMDEAELRRVATELIQRIQNGPDPAAPAAEATAGPTA